MKARIAPHGNKDRDTMKTDSSQYSTTGIRILLSIYSMKKWPLMKIDFTSDFLQTGSAKCDVYVEPTQEYRRKSFYWLLLNSAYEIVNANANWQEHSDTLLQNFRLSQSRFVPQLFFAFKNNRLEIVIVKIIDDFLITAERHITNSFISSVKSQYTFGTIEFGPGSFYPTDINFARH